MPTTLDRIDLTAVTAPDTAGRYYLLPMMDMWTDASSAPGWRTSGTGPSHWLIALLGWAGQVPDGVELITAPTTMGGSSAAPRPTRQRNTRQSPPCRTVSPFAFPLQIGAVSFGHPR